MRNKIMQEYPYPSRTNLILARNEPVLDDSMIKSILNLYYELKFSEMKSMIKNYGELNFFVNLFQYLECQSWREPRNKYLTFVGITIQFSKIYT